MSKREHWFKHDIDSRLVPKMQAYIRMTGADGYGFFWAVVEEMHRKSNEKQKKAIAFEIGFAFGLEKERILLFLESAFEVGLWSDLGDEIYSERAAKEIVLEREKNKHISEIRAKAGAKGGRPKKQTKANESKKKQTKAKRIEETRLDKNNIHSKECINARARSYTNGKIKYGSFVWLSDIEREALIVAHGPEVVTAAIDKLNAHIGRDPNDPKLIKDGQNASATFAAWVFRAVQEDQKKQGVIKKTKYKITVPEGNQ